MAPEAERRGKRRSKKRLRLFNENGTASSRLAVLILFHCKSAGSVPVDRHQANAAILHALLLYTGRRDSVFDAETMKNRDEKGESEEEDRKPPAREITCSPTGFPPDPENELTLDDEADDDASSSAWSPAAGPVSTPFAVSPLVSPHKETPLALTHVSNGLAGPESSTNQQVSLSHFRRRHFREEIVLLAGTSAIAAAVFLYVILPFTALVALATFFTSTSFLFFTTYQHARIEFQDAIQRRGFGDYLPESLWRTLTQTTLHENLQDPSMQIEYQHLMIYFMPGVTRRHLDRYLERMSPAHRDRLLRPGLGWFLGENFMRVILGNERMPRTPRVETDSDHPQIEMLASSPPPTTTPRNRLLYDEDETVESDLGLQISSTDLVGGLSERQASDMVRRLGVADTQDQATPAVDTPVAQTSAVRHTDEDIEANFEEEEVQLIMDAMWVSFYFFVDPVIDFVTERAMAFARPLTSRLFSYSLGLSLLSGGLGLIGYWRGNLAPPSMPRLHYSPSSDTIWSTALFGGVSAGVMLYARAFLMKPKDQGSKK